MGLEIFLPNFFSIFCPSGQKISSCLVKKYPGQPLIYCRSNVCLGQVRACFYASYFFAFCCSLGVKNCCWCEDCNPWPSDPQLDTMTTLTIVIGQDQKSGQPPQCLENVPLKNTKFFSFFLSGKENLIGSGQRWDGFSYLLIYCGSKVFSGLVRYHSNSWWWFFFDNF